MWLEIPYYNYSENISTISFFMLIASDKTIFNRLSKRISLPISSYILLDNGFEFPAGGIGIFKNFVYKKGTKNVSKELSVNLFSTAYPFNWHEKKMLMTPGFILFPQFLFRYKEMNVILEVFTTCAYGTRTGELYYRINPHIQIGYSLNCSHFKFIDN